MERFDLCVVSVTGIDRDNSNLSCKLVANWNEKRIHSNLSTVIRLRYLQDSAQPITLPRRSQ